MTLKTALKARFGTTAGGGDFAARRRAQQRDQAAADRKRKARQQRDRTSARIAAVRSRERQRADRRVAAARAKRPAGKRSGGRSRPAHDYARCRDRDCQRPVCLAYRDGYVEGFTSGVASASES